MCPMLIFAYEDLQKELYQSVLFHVSLMVGWNLRRSSLEGLANFSKDSIVILSSSDFS